MTRIAGVRLIVACRRIGAWVVDWLCIAAWLGLLTLVGHLLGASAWVLPSPVLWHGILFAATVVPVTLWLAWWEARGASPGKRALGLGVLVAGTAQRPGFGRALARNGSRSPCPGSWDISLRPHSCSCRPTLRYRSGPGWSRPCSTR